MNCFHQNGVGTGLTGDLSYPVVPGQLDLYGEFGDDPQGRHLFTGGAYFPGMYQSLGLDLFVEYAQRGDYRGMWTALGYQELRHGWTGLFGVRKVQGGSWEAAAGAFKHFGSLR